MTRVPGVLDLAALARLHRPTTKEGMRLAALDLVRQGNRVRDVAQVLGISEAAVRELLPPGANQDA